MAVSFSVIPATAPDCWTLATRLRWVSITPLRPARRAAGIGQDDHVAFQIDGCLRLQRLSHHILQRQAFLRPDDDDIPDTRPLGRLARDLREGRGRDQHHRARIVQLMGDLGRRVGRVESWSPSPRPRPRRGKRQGIRACWVRGSRPCRREGCRAPVRPPARRLICCIRAPAVSARPVGPSVMAVSSSRPTSPSNSFSVIETASTCTVPCRLG